MEYRIQTGEESFDLDEVIELVSRTYGPNYYDAKEIHGWLLRHEPTLSADNFVLARDRKGSLIGLVRIVIRKICFGGETLSCGGISTVCVHSQWRHRGVATALMETADRVMETRGLDLAFLHARRVLDGFYSKVGYGGINRYLNLEILSPPCSGSELTTVPAQESNISRLERCYESVYRVLTGSIIRRTDMWHFLLGKSPLVKPPYIVHECREKGSDSFEGYLISSGDTLHEAVIPENHFLSVPGLLDKLGLKHIAIHPFHPLFTFLRTTYSTTVTERYAIDGGYMGKILNMDSFLQKYVRNLQFRLRGVQLPFRTLRLSGFELDLDVGTVRRANEADDVHFDDDRILMWFLLGILQPKHISGVRINTRVGTLEQVDLATGFHTSTWDAV